MNSSFPLQLLLLRHAKSDWGDTSLDDADRPLAPRGEKAAKAIGQEISRLSLTPDLILCSPARRARDTLAIATAELETRPPTRIVEDLYDFGDGSGPLEVIRTQGGTAQRLMLVGHNPAFEELAKRLVGSGPADLRKALRQKYPTGALAVIGFNTSRWADIAEGKGRLKRFIRPRDLATAGDA